MVIDISVKVLRETSVVLQKIIQVNNYYSEVTSKKGIIMLISTFVIKSSQWLSVATPIKKKHKTNQESDDADIKKLKTIYFKSHNYVIKWTDNWSSVSMNPKMKITSYLINPKYKWKGFTNKENFLKHHSRNSKSFGALQLLCLQKKRRKTSTLTHDLFLNSLWPFFLIDNFMHCDET